MNEMKKGSRPRHQKKKKTADPDLCSFYEQCSPLQLFFPDYILLIELMNRHFSSKYRNLFFFVALPLPGNIAVIQQKIFNPYVLNALFVLPWLNVVLNNNDLSERIRNSDQ